MNIKNTLVRAAGIAAAVVICWLSLAGVASASAAHPLIRTISPTGTTTGCAIQAFDGHYLTAVGGGGFTTDSIHTNATRIGGWEKFSVVGLGATGYAIQTINGNFLTAVGGGGLGNGSTDAIHTNATVARDWEVFQLMPLTTGLNVYAIQTINGNYLTAVDSGGRTTETIHTDAHHIQEWEFFTITCGH